MKVLIKDIERNIPVTYLVMTNDPDDPKGLKLKMFFCFNCQDRLFQYQGGIAWITPSRTPEAPPFYLKCRSCGKYYGLQAIL